MPQPQLTLPVTALQWRPAEPVPVQAGHEGTPHQPGALTALIQCKVSHLEGGSVATLLDPQHDDCPEAER